MPQNKSSAHLNQYFYRIDQSSFYFWGFSKDPDFPHFPPQYSNYWPKWVEISNGSSITELCITKAPPLRSCKALVKNPPFPVLKENGIISLQTALC